MDEFCEARAELREAEGEGVERMSGTKERQERTTDHR